MIERKIIIGLITSTEFIKLIQNIWDIKLIESASAKRIAEWCWEYYSKFQKAPEKEIESIFFKKLKSGKLPKDIAEEIEQDILPGLSQEYVKKSYNLESLVEETKIYFEERNLSIYIETVEAFKTAGQISEAVKYALNFKPLGTSIYNLDDFILYASQIREKKSKPPVTLMTPWLKEGQLTIIYSPAGCGKTLLTLAISYVLGLNKFDTKKAEIGEWQVKHPTGTLYIDGEMGEVEMEDRIRKYEWLGRQTNKYMLKVLSIPEYQIATEDSFYLSSRLNQIKILQWLKTHPNYKLVILDSASTLFGLEDENNNSEWNNKINPFLRDLRAIKIACILLHHSGKDGKRGLRGASAISAMAQNTFKLTNHKDQDPDAGEAWFTLSKDKQRSGGYNFKTFSLRFSLDGEQDETHWEITTNYSKEEH
jgi:hypothetical protein